MIRAVLECEGYSEDIVEYYLLHYNDLKKLSDLSFCTYSISILADLHKCLDLAKEKGIKISIRDKSIIELYYFKELTQLEVADELGISQQYISSRLPAIIAKISYYLTKERVHDF